MLILVPLAIVAGALLFLAHETPAEQVPIPPDATAVLDDPRFHLPADWQWERLATKSGDVRWGYSEAVNAKAAVLFLPGYSAPLEIYFETFSALTASGYTVIAMDWPGQGGSSRGSEHPEKIHAWSLDGHVQAATDVVDRASDIIGDLPLLMSGLSMGANLGARVLAERNDFVAAALVTPMFGIYGDGPNAVELTILKSLAFVGFGERYALGSTDWTYDMDVHNEVNSYCSHPNDRTKLWYAAMVANPEIKVGGMSNAMALAMVESAKIARSAEVLDRINVPVWMPLAEADVFVSNDAARTACEQIGDCKIQQYAEARHCLFEEADVYYTPFIEDLLGFLDGQLATL